MIPTGRRKFFSASRAKHFFIRQPKKSLGQAGQHITLKNRGKKLPGRRGKSFLKQKNLSLNRKTSPCTEKYFLAGETQKRQPQGLAFLLCVC